MGELRYDGLNGEWVAAAGSRRDRSGTLMNPVLPEDAAEALRRA